MNNVSRRTPPRWVRWTLVCTGAFLACVVFGVTTASADLSLGPHEARYEVTTDSEVTADFGPLGTLKIDSPVRPLGVDVTIKEIPADLTEISQATTLAGLSGDLHSYLQFFGSPQVAIAAVTHALVLDAVRRTVIAIVAVTLVGAGVWFLLGGPRRRELTAVVAPRTWGITAGVVVLVLVGGITSDVVERPEKEAPTSPVFAGTALEGARLTGRLAGVIDTYGAQLVGIYRQNEDFYADARTSLQAAWDKEAAIDARLAAAAASQGTAGIHDGTPSPSPDGTPSGSPSAAAGAGAGAKSSETAPVTLLVVSDLHCNMSMTPLIRDIAERSHADVMLDAGDTTVNGTAVEKVCIDSFATARPKGVEMAVSDGNHDSALIVAAEKSHGIKVLDGSVIELDGVHILGDRDPNETRVGGGTSSRGETANEVSERLAETACEAGDVDLLLIHTPAVGDRPLESGCVPFQVSGHTHKRHDPFAKGQGIRYVNGSTAGAKSGQPTVGPLHGIAEMTLLRFDPVEHRFTAWKLVEVFPDATAKVSPWQPVPPRPEPVVEGLGLPHDGVATPTPSPTPQP
ncbi:metallophosphoesterase family protein [Xylanimonas sp. McL0601]|uniref:metallophosphoesterase family protein n=1 Tax=Xylanimonas sp. McL0601 TaxID=3414739 RepID=UPI003CF1688B